MPDREIYGQCERKTDRQREIESETMCQTERFTGNVKERQTDRGR